MDEMEEYRNRIERRYGDRRKKDRRRYVRAPKKPVDWITLLMLLILMLFGFAIHAE